MWLMLVGMEPTDVDPNPLRQLGLWLDEARAAGEPMPEAMALATATPAGVPSVRMVILRGLDRGPVFFTDGQSAKGADLHANPRVALVLHWLRPVHRQVRVVGPVGRTSSAEDDAYWSGRPTATRTNMAASHQSRVVGSRSELEHGAQHVRGVLPDGAALARPDRWGGWRVTPDAVELWEEAPDGLHDRLRYRRVGSEWTIERLAP
jgi:pyridoxamine 5'-phosphate oxidase